MSFIVFLSLCCSLDRGVTCEVNPDKLWMQFSEQAYLKPLPLKTVPTLSAASESRFSLLLPPGTGLILKCDPLALTVSDTLVPDYGLTSDAEKAIDAAPSWLRFDLVDNLRQLDVSRQNTLADMILNPSDPRLRDEIAFQVAHISPSHLGVVNLDVIRQNVDSLFAIDRELKYAEIVDYGNPDKDSNYYSTIRYKVLKNGITLSCEIPKEIYYWYIIHPRGTDENPAIIYDKFWREYLYYDNGSTSYTVDGEYPLLREALDTVEFAWEVTPQSSGGGAVAAVYNWVNGVVKWGATGNRPIQPNEIATDHDGNCGEFQDITWAGGRTALIPTVGVLDINEDHVWCTMWQSKSYESALETTWRPDSGGAFDKDHGGGGKYCSMIWQWRGDGYQESRIQDYSNSCTLTVKITDPNGIPLSNLNAELDSEGWMSSMRVRGLSGITDRNGLFVITVGEEQNYYLKVAWNSFGLVVDSVSSTAGKNILIERTINTDYLAKPRNLDDINKSQHFSIEGKLDTVLPLPSEPCYLVFFNNHAEMGEVVSGSASVSTSGISLSIDAEYDLGHCETYSYEATSSVSTLKFSPGELTDFFITDRQGIYTLGVSDVCGPQPSVINLDVKPITTSGVIEFKISGAKESVRLSVFDISGRKVYSAFANADMQGNVRMTWMNTRQTAGVYFARVESMGNFSVAKFIIAQ